MAMKDSHCIEAKQWDFNRIAEAMVQRAQKHGVLPANVGLAELLAPSENTAQFRENARRMICAEKEDEDDVIDEGALWDLFGMTFSSSVAQTLAQHDGLSPIQVLHSPYDCAEGSMPKSLQTIRCAAWAFARSFTYDLDPLHCGSLHDEQFCSAMERCLILSQQMGAAYGRTLAEKKQKLDLNLRLLEACRAEKVDYAEIETLLKQGAEPLGYIEEYGYPDNLYDDVVEGLSCMEDKNGDLLRITDLFLRYGMDVSRPTIPYDNDEILNPIYHFCGYMCGSMMETLRLLLDHGLSAEDAAWGWGQQLEDFLNVSDSLSDENVRGELPYYVQKLMLTASYPHVLKQDAGLRCAVWLDQNHYDLSRFREWDWYDFELDTSRSRCNRGHPCVAGSVITIRDKASGEAVWRFGVRLDPEAAP